MCELCRRSFLGGVAAFAVAGSMPKAIAQGTTVTRFERAAATLSRIAAMGSTIALDDFGIGNTSISQLRDLPIDTLKPPIVGQLCHPHHHLRRGF